MLVKLTESVFELSLERQNVIWMTDAFEKSILNNAGCKRNKIWLDQGKKFYNKLMKSWLHKSGTDI